MKKTALYTILLISILSFSSCKKYGCSCDGQPVTGQTYTSREPGSNVAKISCQADSDCEWVVVE